MNNFNTYFTSYEAMDPPPIITADYKLVEDNYKQYLRQLPDYSLDNTLDIQFKELNLENQNIKEINNPLVESTMLDKKTSNTTLSSDIFKNKVLNYFTDKGLSINQARGIYGNLMQESGGNIKAISKDGYNSYGIAQWTGDRKVRLFSQYGRNPTLDQQLEYLWWELNNTHKSTLQGLKNSKTIKEATSVFMNKFERPSIKYANFNKRLKYAET